MCAAAACGKSPKPAFDIHDRVNYAVTDQTLKINTDKKVISLNLQIDTDICSMYEYFENFSREPAC